MKKVEIEILDNAINCVVVKLPERKFPGVVIQGDSLWILYSSVRGLQRVCKGKISDEADDELSDLLDLLSMYVHHYESTLEAHGIDLPYYGEINESG
jgi:hypothetical protein